MQSPGAEDQRRQQLLAAKLRALVKTAEPGVPIEADQEKPRLPTGTAGLVTKSGDAWFLAEHDAARYIGAALVWLGRAAPTESAHHHVIIGEHDAVAVVACRLSVFARRPHLYRGDGTEAREVAIPTIDEAKQRVEPPQRFDPNHIDDHSTPIVRDLLQHVRSIDAITVERDRNGVYFAVRGLEMARIEHEGEGEGVFLDIGVGKFDRSAYREVSGGQPLDAERLPAVLHALHDAVTAILERRRADAPEHQIRSLRKERWLRARVITDPTIAGLPAGLMLTPIAPPVAPPDLVTRVAAPAVSEDGREVVVCSTGIDLDLVPTAAHTWLQAAAPVDSEADEPRLTIVVPEPDDHHVTRTLLESLVPRLRARLVTVPATWMTE